MSDISGDDVAGLVAQLRAALLWIAAHDQRETVLGDKVVGPLGAHALMALASSPPSGTVPSPEEGTAGGTQGSRFTEGYVFAINDAMRVIRSGLIASDRDAQWVAENVQALAYLRRAPSPLPEAPTPPSAEAAGVPDGWHAIQINAGAVAKRLEGAVASIGNPSSFPAPIMAAAAQFLRGLNQLAASPSPPSEPMVLMVTEEAVKAATRVICHGLPLPKPDERPLAAFARGCLAPNCACYQDGLALTKAALEAALPLMGRKPATSDIPPLADTEKEPE